MGSRAKAAHEGLACGGGVAGLNLHTRTGAVYRAAAKRLLERILGHAPESLRSATDRVYSTE
jgi:hypothetical protein